MAYLVDQQPTPDYVGQDPDGHPYWYVEDSGTGPFHIEYLVKLTDEDGYTCDCRAFGPCRHIRAVKQMVRAALV